MSDHASAEGMRPHSGASNFDNQPIRLEPRASNFDAKTRSRSGASKLDGEGTRPHSAASKFNDQSASALRPGVIRPSYLGEHGEAWSVEVGRVLEGRIEKKSLNRILNAIKVGQNGLFNRLVDTVYEPDRRTYLCFSEHVYLDLKNQGPVENALVHGWEEFQGRFPFFTNAFAFCELNDGRYCGSAPKTRVTNSGKLVLTFEWDVADSKFLDQQIRWSIAGSDKKSPLDRLYAHLSRYWDFRWLEAVWSGHKSVHLHILLDSRHLSPSRFEGEFPRPPSLIRDVPAHLFRNGVRSCSELLGHLVQETLAVDPAFTLDPGLNYRIGSVALPGASALWTRAISSVRLPGCAYRRSYCGPKAVPTLERVRTGFCNPIGSSKSNGKGGEEPALLTRSVRPFHPTCLAASSMNFQRCVRSSLDVRRPVRFRSRSTRDRMAGAFGSGTVSMIGTPAPSWRAIITQF
jgi:hypothetical protein